MTYIPIVNAAQRIIEDTGAEATGLNRGDLVLSPFTYADNASFW